MEKTNGDPQFMAFQVPDPADKDKNEITQRDRQTRSSCTTRRFFQSQVESRMDKAKQHAGLRAGHRGRRIRPCCATPRSNGRTRYEYRETFYFVSHLFLHVRCSRPLLKDTAQAWIDAYNNACADIMRRN